MNEWNEFGDNLTPELLDAASGIENRDNAMMALQQGGALQRTGTGYSTAIRVQEPRNLQIKRKQLLAEARMAGESFYYGWGAGKNKVLGPSIGLAMSAARLWGNCAVDMAPVQDTPDSWIFTAQFIDLETGTTISRQFRQQPDGSERCVFLTDEGRCQIHAVSPAGSCCFLVPRFLAGPKT